MSQVKTSQTCHAHMSICSALTCKSLSARAMDSHHMQHSTSQWKSPQKKPTRTEDNIKTDGQLGGKVRRPEPPKSRPSATQSRPSAAQELPSCVFCHILPHPSAPDECNALIGNQCFKYTFANFCHESHSFQNASARVAKVASRRQ